MTTIDPHSPVPKYFQLRAILLDLIESAELPVDAPIPSERELCVRYELSRMTVRQGVDQLVSEGRLYRVPGRARSSPGPRSRCRCGSSRSPRTCWPAACAGRDRPRPPDRPGRRAARPDLRCRTRHRDPRHRTPPHRRRGAHGPRTRAHPGRPRPDLLDPGSPTAPCTASSKRCTGWSSTRATRPSTPAWPTPRTPGTCRSPGAVPCCSCNAARTPEGVRRAGRVDLQGGPLPDPHGARKSPPHP